MDSDPAPAYLLLGEGAGLSGLLGELWLARVREKGAAAELSRWTAADLERETAAAWRSPSFFASVRIYVLPDLGEMKKAARDDVARYLLRPVPGVILVLSGASTRSAARPFPGVPTLAVREEEAVQALAEHVVSAARGAGAKMAREAAAFLVRWVGVDFARLKEELGKLLAYAGGAGEIGEDAIRAVCVAGGGADPFALAEAILKKDARAGLALFRAFAATAESQDYHALLGAMAWKTRQSASGGRGPAVAPGRAGEILGALSAIDRGIKGESGLSPEQLFEIGLLRLLR